MSHDTQVTEAIGQGLVIARFLREGFEVARPVRDNGIDLVVYRNDPGGRFECYPVQLKVASWRSFGIWKKYESIPELRFVYAWEIEESPQYFRLTYGEALAVAEEMGWTKTKSWTKDGAYVNTEPGERLREFLAPYEWSLTTKRDPVASR